jgi:hypothetical protein
MRLLYYSQIETNRGKYLIPTNHARVYIHSIDIVKKLMAYGLWSMVYGPKIIH